MATNNTIDFDDQMYANEFEELRLMELLLEDIANDANNSKLYPFTSIYHQCLKCFIGLRSVPYALRVLLVFLEFFARIVYVIHLANVFLNSLDRLAELRAL